VAATRMISIIGRRNAGKTTFLNALAAELVRRKFRVVTIDEATDRDADPIALARRSVDADMVLVEGFADAPVPKIEVYRSAAGLKPLFDPAVHDPGDWVAMVTDDRDFRAPFPVFRFSDTAWLVTLANLAWDRAKILPP